MADQRSRESLLGLRATLPPNALAEGCEFGDDQQYREFLRSSTVHLDQFWNEVGNNLRWDTPPNELGRPGDWYPGGRLDLVNLCVGDDLQRPLLHTWSSESGEVCSISGDEMLARVSALHGHFSKNGLAHSSRVLIITHDPATLWSAVIACFAGGWTCVPVNPSYAAERIVDRGQKAGCAAVLLDGNIEGSGSLREAFGDERVALFEEVAPADDLGVNGFVTVGPMHPLFVLADSSGQLFSLPAAGFLAQASTCYRHLLVGKPRGQGLWILSEPHHASMLAAVLGAMMSGDAVGILPYNKVATRDDLVALVEATKARSLLTNVKTIVPLTGPEDTNAEGGPRKTELELIIVEGEALEPHLSAVLRSEMFGRGTHVVQVLARPEVGGFVAGPHPALTPVRPGSVAYGAPGMDLTILNQKGDECAIGHGGLLALKAVTPGLPLEMQGKEPPLVIEVKARRDREKRFWPMGEAALELSANEVVSLAELEATIAGVEGVDQVAVIRYNERGRPMSRAFIKPSSESVDVTRRVAVYITERLGPAAVPASFQVVQTLPVGRSGKLLRSLLRRIVNGDPISKDDAGMVLDPELIEQLNLATSENET